MSAKHPFLTARTLALAATLAIPAYSTSWAQAVQPAPAQRAASATDDALEDHIAYRFETNDAVRKYDVKVDVTAGVAQLTGEVATEAQKAEAEKLAAGVEGIQRVESRVEVDPTADQTVTERAKAGLSKTGEAINDAWITTKVKWFIAGEDILDNSDINVDTKANVVTLKGRVANEAGRIRAMRLAGRTEGVKNVVDELTVAPPK
jgi:hyperosmotically inducible protein